VTVPTSWREAISTKRAAVMKNRNMVTASKYTSPLPAKVFQMLASRAAPMPMPTGTSIAGRRARNWASAARKMGAPAYIVTGRVTSRLQ
jgi:hypothetical protein